MIAWNDAPQGSEAWLAARLGRITGSRFKDARAKLKNGSPADDCKRYAMDLARERLGGSPPKPYQTPAMTVGREQEGVARMLYEARTGELVEEVGFAYTADGIFGLSPDGLIGNQGAFECKTVVSSSTMFKAMVDGDISEYRDQCIGYLWLLHLQWVDLCLWCPDLSIMRVFRITRNEEEIDALASDLIQFNGMVEDYKRRLAAVREQWSVAGVAMPIEAEVAPEPEPKTEKPAAQAVAPEALPELF